MLPGPSTPAGARATADPRADRGAASLSVVLLTPVFLFLAFATWQAAIWTHTRTEARVVARETAAQVARGGVPVEAAAEAARVTLVADDVLDAPEVSIVRLPIEGSASGTMIQVTVRGDALGLLTYTSTEISVTEAVPEEGFRLP